MSSSRLVECPGCSRHVRVGEPECPFCRVGLAGLTAPPRRRAKGRLTRLALVAGVALASTACGPTANTPDDSIREQEGYGDDEPPPEDDPEPGTDPSLDDDAEGEAEAGDEPAPVALSGGPSIEMLV